MEIDLVTAHELVAGGIDAGDLDALCLAAIAGNAAIRRMLERAIGTPLLVALRDRDEQYVVPDQLLLLQRRGNWQKKAAAKQYDRLLARIELGPGVVWCDGTLTCNMPLTMRMAVIGRPLREVVDHTALDGDAITQAPTRGGLLMVPGQYRRLKPASLRQRLRIMRTSLTLIYAEMRFTEMPKGMLAIYGGYCAFTLLVAIFMTALAQPGFGRLMIVTDWLTCLYAAIKTIEIASGRAGSVFNLVTAESRHITMLRDCQRYRHD